MTNPLALIPLMLMQILIPQVTQVRKKCLITYTDCSLLLSSLHSELSI